MLKLKDEYMEFISILAPLLFTYLKFSIITSKKKKDLNNTMFIHIKKDRKTEPKKRGADKHTIRAWLPGGSQNYWKCSY